MANPACSVLFLLLILAVDAEAAHLQSQLISMKFRRMHDRPEEPGWPLEPEWPVVPELPLEPEWPEPPELPQPPELICEGTCDIEGTKICNSGCDCILKEDIEEDGDCKNPE